MPEIVTSHPDLVIKLLQGAGAKCGTQKAKILTSCPTDKLCQLPGGELCVYGLEHASTLPQQQVLSQAQTLNWDASMMLLVFGVFMLGLVLGLFIKKSKKPK